jgi:hypothetical protein
MFTVSFEPVKEHIKTNATENLVSNKRRKRKFYKKKTSNTGTHEKKA